MPVSKYYLLEGKVRLQIETSLEAAQKRREKFGRSKDKASQVRANFHRGNVAGIMRLAKKMGYECKCNLADMKKKSFCYCQRREPERRPNVTD